MKIRIIFLILLITSALASCKSNKTVISSPGRQIRIVFIAEAESGNPEIILETRAGKEILRALPEISCLPQIAFKDLRFIKSETSSIRLTWENQFGEKCVIPDNYNQARVYLESKGIMVTLIIRVYNEGAAFAYEFPPQQGIDSLYLDDENILFTFKADHLAWSAPRAQALYSHVPLSAIDKGCERPLVIEIDSSYIIALAEAGLVDYARMKFDPDPTVNYSIRSRLDGEVRKSLPFISPWRVIMVGKNVGDLLERNYLLLNLNKPSEIDNTEWIRPGKALREVTLTTTGAMALVDFIDRHNMQYIEFDAGWYGYEYDDSSDARSVNVDPRRSKGPLELEKIVSYAKSKNIGVLLYVNRRALERQLDELLPLYRSWGVSGIKFGFVQVGTQQATSWMHEAIRKCADLQLVVDIHDEYRPTGYSRTYPNFLTQEGIRGDEESPPNSHTLITMFTRMLAGAGDNTICYFDRRVNEKMGSHASQLAKAVCIFSPLQFLYWYDRLVPAGREYELSDKPNYLSDEPEMEFFDKVPTVWDETKVLHSRIGEYGVIARRKGDEWFIGGINGSQSRELDIDFSFLTRGKKYMAKIYTDDPSAGTRTNVRIDLIEVTGDDVYKAVLASNNGIAMYLSPL